ncbi:MAG: dicarboxylate/amino acid:cation symporter [Clostridium sp.]|nr:dicarboxylate/amino acid:cation symporter [Clostridium sp.]
MWKLYKRVPLVYKLMCGMVLGVVCGILFGERMQAFEIFGTLFLNLLKMACVPLIFFNLVSGISSLDGPEVFGRIGVKSLAYYGLTTIFAAVVGVGGGLLLRPGAGLVLTESYQGEIAEVPGMLDTLVGMVPSNIFSALANTKLDQVVVFSVFAGIAVLMMEKEDKNMLFKAFNAFARLFNKMVAIVMGYAPIGVFALIGSTVGKYGAAMFGPAMKYIVAVAVCMLVHFCIYFVILFIMTGKTPLDFLKKTFALIATTCSTSSSVASVPVNMECAKNLGCSQAIYGFTIPLGSQMNKDGQAIMLTISLLFAAQAAGVTFGFSELVKAILIALLLTTGSGGIPGGGLVTIAIIIDTFSMPTEAVAIISGVFFIIDLLNTTMNCYGDLVGTYIVDYTEKKRQAKVAKAVAH